MKRYSILQKTQIKPSIAFVVLAIMLMGNYSCKQNDIETYQGERYIQFAQKYTDTISVAFFLYPKENVLRVKIPVKYIGQMTTEDTPIAFQVNEKESTISTDVYKFEAKPIVRQGRSQDSISLEVYRSPKIHEKEFKLVIDLKPTDKLSVGETISSRKVIKISDKIIQPKWWNAIMISTYLGKYTDAKYRKFIEVVGEGDLEIFTIEKQRDLMLQFKYYLIQMRTKGTPVLEDDGSDMLSTIPLIG